MHWTEDMKTQSRQPLAVEWFGMGRQRVLKSFIHDIYSNCFANVRHFIFVAIYSWFKKGCPLQTLNSKP
jgi:hypothetical protein